MARQFARRAAPDDLKSFEYAKADGTIRTMHARDGYLSPQDGEDDAALAAAGYEQHADDVKEIDERDDAALEAEAEEAKKQRQADAEAEEKAAQARADADAKAADEGSK